VLVTHHGSRGLGARLYKHGRKIAEGFRKQLSPETLPANAWIPYDTDEGRDYWDALQVVRLWTKENHTSIHDLTVEAIGGTVHDRFWNEHNFVFRESIEDGNHLFWHAKGATPIHNAFMPDTNGVQIVPLNMAEPILFVKSERNDTNRGFAPHGAGRNMSRTAHKKRMAGRTDAQILKSETEGLDVRFYTGITDISELPSAYKNADAVVKDMNAFSLATVVDRVMPFGSIMAGGGNHDARWRKKRKSRDQDRNSARSDKRNRRRG